LITEDQVTLYDCECRTLAWKRAKGRELHAVRGEAIEKLLSNLWRNIEAALGYQEDTGVLDAFNELEAFLLGS
jgi:hypothetical protein